MYNKYAVNKNADEIVQKILAFSILISFAIFPAYAGELAAVYVNNSKTIQTSIMNTQNSGSFNSKSETITTASGGATNTTTATTNNTNIMQNSAAYIMGAGIELDGITGTRIILRPIPRMFCK